MLDGMDRDRLLQMASELDDPAEISRLLATALLNVGSLGGDPPSIQHGCYYYHGHRVSSRPST